MKECYLLIVKIERSKGANGQDHQLVRRFTRRIEERRDILILGVTQLMDDPIH